MTTIIVIADFRDLEQLNDLRTYSTCVIGSGYYQKRISNELSGRLILRFLIFVNSFGAVGKTTIVNGLNNQYNNAHLPRYFFYNNSHRFDFIQSHRLDLATNTKTSPDHVGTNLA